VRTLKDDDQPFWCLALSSDGKHLATGTGDNAIYIWDFAEGAIIKKLIGHTNIIESVHFSPDNQHLIAGSDDGTCSLWKLK
jgi:WD40 repeat protein